MKENILFIKSGKILDISNEKIIDGNLLIQNGVIQALNPSIETVPDEATIFDAEGMYIAPGFIDAHLHIESSMMPPLQFSHQAIKHGTTMILVDPHEITNVAGMQAMNTWIDQAHMTPLDMFIAVPSCVPATHMETSGATLGLDKIKILLQNDFVYGLGEMMNYPGIIHGIGDARAKVTAAIAANKLVDGHAPGVSGEDLDAYLTNGKNDGLVRIMSDHESTTPEEVKEKLRKGMHIALRYGSASKDLDVILPALLEEKVDLDQCMLCSDDISPSELYEAGHIDRIIIRAREIILEKTDKTLEEATLLAIRLASYTSGKYIQPFLKLTKRAPVGQIKPGYRANLVILNSLEQFTIHSVIHKGQFVVEDHEVLPKIPEYDYGNLLQSINISKQITPKDFQVSYTGNQTEVAINVIQTTPASLITKKVIKKLKVADTNSSEAKEILADSDQDILKIAVFERHHNTGNQTIGFIQGLKIKNGAIGSTVAHDNHNLIIVGTNDEDMAHLANFMKDKGGGMAALSKNEVTFHPLQIGGLMSTHPIELIVENYQNVKKTAKKMGTPLDNVFMTLSFMALAVIPELKITDKGLIDVNQFEIINLFAK